MNEGNENLAYSKVPSNFILRHFALQGDNFMDLILSEFGYGIRLSAFHKLRVFSHTIAITKCRSSFLACVNLILGVVSKEKMRWIHALWIVAMMANKQLVWDWTIMDLIGKAVGLGLVRATAGSESAIPIFVSSFSPYPTLVGTSDFYMAPKSLDWVGTFSWVMSLWHDILLT